MNTPQFSWVKSRLPRKPQPVPPIFQPEVAAEAIVWAATHRRREVWVGKPTVEAITAQKFFPGLLDLYLGKTGYDAQQYDGAADPNRPNNLWEPLPGDFGAHGEFDSRSHDHSWQVKLDLNRRWIGLGLLAGGAALAWFTQREKISRAVEEIGSKVAA
ncbi:MAG: hypothetical protein JOZ10_03840 [Acidobacteria bacterium]|nr:hypothetical protein [Acidobacteriota bacterium]